MRFRDKAAGPVQAKISEAIRRIKSSGIHGYDRIERFIEKKRINDFFNRKQMKQAKKRLKLIGMIEGVKKEIAEAAASTADDERGRVWRMICRKQIPKVSKQLSNNLSIKLSNAKRTAMSCAKETKKMWTRQNRLAKDAQNRSRKQMREMLVFWKRNEKEERELRRRAEKEAAEQRRVEEEQREARRQAKKLNFLLTQTELFSHFMANKPSNPIGDQDITVDLDGVDLADVDDSVIRAKAAQIARQAAEKNRAKVDSFTSGPQDQLDFSKAELDQVLLQPRMLQATLKEYQLKGLSWMANLYEQGINGILADEMGLGKTIQAISLLAHLAESHGIWGPFIIVAPASTLHNWQQELTRFVPAFKVMPYWGAVADRKMLRKFWPSTSKRPFSRDSTFHIMVTSYQMVVTDQAFLSKIRWQYMILDEAQAIKSSTSQRWNVLLGFQCRNRLLLTGTPIQNTMQELWALLHFIMPSLFDSHDEFSDWFSKDIESKAAAQEGSSTATAKNVLGGFDQHQLSRLHMILKPFMLRRVKKDVQSELPPKTEIDLICDLAPKQRRLYRAIKQRLPVAELLKSASSTDSEASAAALMNIVMQFRKVCNHPELFEREPIISPMVWHDLGAICPKEDVLLRWPGALKNPIKLDYLHLIQQEPTSTVLKIEPKETVQPFIKTKETFGVELDLELKEVKFLTDRLQTAYIPTVVATVPMGSISSSAPDTISNNLTFDYSIGRRTILPDFGQTIMDCGKMTKLDSLLTELKAGGHRVLLYNQMTRMIDLMEEYLQYRGYRYLRLDGSTRIADRRDMVNDWQNGDPSDPASPFIFLLSTRAGGLGINLTAADTVIFYDSDWNPTVDQQAMDRAHRLGQSRPVTVYRLITRSTIEERIQQRALQKDLVHKVVIAGGDFGADGQPQAEGATATTLKARDVASLLLDEADDDDDQKPSMPTASQKRMIPSGESLKPSKQLKTN